MTETVPVGKEKPLHPHEVIAREWFEAFNTHDIERLLSLYDDNAQHYSPRLRERQPKTKGWISGKEALRAWWQDAFERLPSLRYKILSLIPNGSAVHMRYERFVDGEATSEVTEVLLIQNGKIIESRVLSLS